jgi:hypothetical protein
LEYLPINTQTLDDFKISQGFGFYNFVPRDFSESFRESLPDLSLFNLGANYHLLVCGEIQLLWHNLLF